MTHRLHRPESLFVRRAPQTPPAPKVKPRKTKSYKVYINFGADGEHDQFIRHIYALDKESAIDNCIRQLNAHYGEVDEIISTRAVLWTPPR